MTSRFSRVLTNIVFVTILMTFASWQMLSPGGYFTPFESEGHLINILFIGFFLGNVMLVTSFVCALITYTLVNTIFFVLYWIFAAPLKLFDSLRLHYESIQTFFSFFIQGYEGKYLRFRGAFFSFYRWDYYYRDKIYRAYVLFLVVLVLNYISLYADVIAYYVQPPIER